MRRTNRAQRIVLAVTIDYQLQYHNQLPERLVAEGWEVHVVSSAGPNLTRLGLKPGVFIHPVTIPRRPDLLRDLKVFFRLIAILGRLRPLVTLVGTPKAGLISGIAALMTLVPLRIYELHGLRLEGSTGVRRVALQVIERATAMTATHVIPVGHSLAEVALKHNVCPAEKMQVLGQGSPNGVDLKRFRLRQGTDEIETSFARNLGLDPALRTIGFVGRLTRDKGLPEFAEALTELKRRGSDCQVLVVGAVDDPTGTEGLDHLRRTGQKVIATGHVDDVSALYRLMDVFCLPSLREGLPTVLLEAFASGIPVVARNATGSRDLVVDGVTGRLVQSGSGTELAATLQKALDEVELTSSMAVRAREVVERDYSQNLVQSNWIQFITSIIDDDKVGPDSMPRESASVKRQSSDPSQRLPLPN